MYKAKLRYEELRFTGRGQKSPKCYLCGEKVSIWSLYGCWGRDEFIVVKDKWGGQPIHACCYGHITKMINNNLKKSEGQYV